MHLAPSLSASNPMFFCFTNPQFFYFFLFTKTLFIIFSTNNSSHFMCSELFIQLIFQLNYPMLSPVPWGRVVTHTSSWRLVCVWNQTQQRFRLTSLPDCRVVDPPTQSGLFRSFKWTSDVQTLRSSRATCEALFCLWMGSCVQWTRTFEVLLLGPFTETLVAKGKSQPFKDRKTTLVPVTLFSYNLPS